MKLLLKRIAKKELYVIGKLYIDGVYFCDTIEDTDRGLKASMSKEEIEKIKIKSKTAIPTGTYSIDMNTVSPKFSSYDLYKKIDGKLPRLIGVKGFEGILIHIGNAPKDTDGCILVGKNDIVGLVSLSTVWFNKLYPILVQNKDNLTITIE